MEINKIVDIFNSHIKDKYNTKTHFILKKEIVNNKVTKSLKTIKYSLWYVNGTDIHNVFYRQYTLVGATESKEQLAKNYVEEQVIRAMFNLPYLKEFNDMMNGEFKGFKETEEQL